MTPTKRQAVPAKAALKPKVPGLAKFQETFAKSFGEDTLRLGGEIKPYDVISTGSVLLDFATGIGGLPQGRVIEWWGPDGSGKTTLAFIAAAMAQKKFPTKIVGFIDMEQAGDLAWAKLLGVDVEGDTFAHVQPDSAEDVADIMKAMLESGLFSFIILDSVGGMLTEEEMRKDAEDVVVGTNAKVITRMVKMAAIYARKTDAVVLLLNQVRAQIGGYGPDEVTSGGWALKHGTSMRFKFRRTQSGNVDVFKIGSGDEQTSVGFETAVTIEKNKCAPPKRKATLAIFNQPSAKFGDLVGLDVVRETANLANRLDLLPKRGAWFILGAHEDPKLEDKVNGLPELIARLRTDAPLMERLRVEALTSVSHLITDDSSVTGELVDGDGPLVIGGDPPGFRKGVDAATGDGVDVLVGS